MIDRMELEDIGGNPTKLAEAILLQLDDITKAIPVRNIAASLDIYEIREEPNLGFEGALIAPDDKSEGAIIVRADRPETRKRFTIGHELGHYLNPYHRADSPNGFQCNARDLAAEASAKNNSYWRMEAEANEFSAALLMPAARIAKFLRGRSGAEIEHILELADSLQVSKEAMARRYVELNDRDPSAIVFSKNGLIRHACRHQDFPWLNVRNGMFLPRNSLSAINKLDVGEVSDWKEFQMSEWIDHTRGTVIYEQTMAQANGFRLTLLTFESNEECDEDTNLEDSWTPRFPRGR